MSDIDDYTCGGLPSEEAPVIDLPDTEFETDTEGNKGSWLEDCKSMVNYNANTTYVESGAIKICFVEVEHITQQGDQAGGAILFTLLDLETGEVVEKWIPKKLCSNLHPEGRWIWVWNVFAEQHLRSFYEVPED